MLALSTILSKITLILTFFQRGKARMANRRLLNRGDSDFMEVF